MRFKGRAWVLGDNISTDHIISGKYKFKAISSLEDMLPHVFEEVIPEFYKRVRPGDIIVAGRNFGLGSSREHAPRLIKMTGISVIVAKSFARIFFRNAINIGLPVVEAIEIPGKTSNGDIIEVDIGSGIIRNTSKGVEERIHPYPRVIQDILREGGIIEYLARHGGFKWLEDTR